MHPGAVNGVDLWRTAVMRPAGDANPLLALARALFVTGDAKDDPGGFGPALPELTREAFETPELLAAPLTGAAEGRRGSHPHRARSPWPGGGRTSEV